MFLTVVVLIHISLVTKIQIARTAYHIYLEQLLRLDLYVSEPLCCEENVLARHFGVMPFHALYVIGPASPLFKPGSD